MLLIVDDEVELAESVSMLFSGQNIHIVLAHDGLDGLSKVEKETFDCIVTDISMPRMNGLLFLKELRQRKIETPVIIYTGFGCEESILEASKLGCFEFIDKPELEGLEETVYRALKVGRQIQEGTYKSKADESDLQEFQRLLKNTKE